MYFACPCASVDDKCITTLDRTRSAQHHALSNYQLLAIHTIKVQITHCAISLVLLAGLPDDLELHHIIVNDWSHGVDSEQNVVLISIPSIMDPSLAPAGKHTLHAYLPATEPYHLWEGLDRQR